MTTSESAGVQVGETVIALKTVQWPREQEQTAVAMKNLGRDKRASYKAGEVGTVSYRDGLFFGVRFPDGRETGLVSPANWGRYATLRDRVSWKRQNLRCT